MKDKFIDYLKSCEQYEEFSTELMDHGEFKDVSSLCASVDDPNEFVAEAFIWTLPHWRIVDANWRCECGSKKRWYDPRKGFSV